MINTNEIRRGNFLNCGTDEDDEGNEITMPGRVLQIFDQTIHWTNVLDQENTCDGYSATDADFIDPIPLTAEWLERCGFVRGSSYIGIGYHWDGPNEISIVQQQVDKEDTYRLYGSEWTIGKDFKYLHQLQNLYFALTGEELTIKESV